MYTGQFLAPYVPTAGSDILQVLRYAKLKKNSTFVDLGCGDGRIVITAVREFQVHGVGVEMIPHLIWFAKLWAKLLKLDHATFIRQDLFKYPLQDVDVLYIFLMPKMMKKMVVKINTECKKGTIIISRGFEIPGRKPFYCMETRTFWTYFYRI